MKTRRQYRLAYAKKLLQQEAFLEKVETDLRMKTKTTAEKLEKIHDEISK